MAVHPLRLRRALSLSFSLLNHSLHRPRPIISSTFSHLVSTPSAATSSYSSAQLTRPFTSTTTLFRRNFDHEPGLDEIGPDTILFEGCDYNHWLITMDFPKDSNLTREQMIETYVNTAAQVFGSVEEAKKKIYALSTTTYQGFQVLCSEETSEKFKSIPGVVFVLPDSYIDPVNKEYGGDKYINGEIIPRPPPVQYGRRSNRDRRPREQNYGPPPQQNYGPPPQQNYGQRPQQNYAPPPQQNYGQQPQQNFRPPPQQNYGPPPQQNYGSPPQQSYRPSQQGYAPRPHQSYGSPPQQSYVPETQQNFGNTPNFPPQQNHTPAGSGERSGFTPPNNTLGHGERNSMPSYQGNFNQAELRNHYTQGQGNSQSNVPPEQRGFSQDANYGFSQGGSFEHVSGGQGNLPSVGNN